MQLAGLCSRFVWVIDKRNARQQHQGFALIVFLVMCSEYVQASGGSLMIDGRGTGGGRLRGGRRVSVYQQEDPVE